MRGIDVSSHNGKIDWKTVKSSGIDFAIIRAGYGVGTLDRYYASNVLGAYNVGIKTGIYWFSYALNEEDATSEADFCAESLIGSKLSLPIFYDFEYDTERYAKEHNVTFTPESRTSIIKAFCDRMKKHGYESGIYTNLDYIKHKLNFADLKEYPLWLASYGTNEEQTIYGEILKQTTDKGSVAGINGNVDLNVCFIKEIKPVNKETTDNKALDNEPSEWSREAVEWAVKNKILQGDENGDYKLLEPCTTERFITLLYRAIKSTKMI